jgi:hypothetical protein
MHVPWAEDADGDDIPTHYSCLDLHGAHPYTLVDKWTDNEAAKMALRQGSASFPSAETSKVPPLSTKPPHASTMLAGPVHHHAIDGCRSRRGDDPLE